MKIIKDFLLEVEKRYSSKEGTPTTLSLFGTSALYLQSDYQGRTKDADILEVNDIKKSDKDKLIQIAGKGSNLAKQHRLYLDFVAKPIPFLPLNPNWHSLENLNKELKILRFEVLDITDVVISKLKTFRPSDRDDIQAMIDRELVNQSKLVGRFKLAVEKWSLDARAEDLPTIVSNLHTVERDYLLVEPTPFNLPRWV